ncbi:Pyrophosphate--fructose 6-phosphate 1-phosphotransferase subunit alpha [Camellia lanceoleosa]|uniref:Pyrophosphate--fructose 6-phosphate 1-phosphotransferase subunit alpha n=1 Tax=Camellia lanceoleosa TaxID=1840588 RepID=A0ACC0ID32_9ERIC|nr:Pyrophosphate--fructose 6-phosphate 1-phosphotransferase subunit alpha [Camellia lanceoleosa]
MKKEKANNEEEKEWQGSEVEVRRDKYHGVILLPDGLIESIPEVYGLLQEIHGLFRQVVSVDNISSQLSPWASALFEFLPPSLESSSSSSQNQMNLHSYPRLRHKLLAHLVEAEINKRLSSIGAGTDDSASSSQRCFIMFVINNHH